MRHHFPTSATMLHGIAPNLTAVALLVHAVLGCCWHHAHCCPHSLSCATDANLSGDGAAFEQGEHDCCCSRALAADDHHGGDGCQGVPCRFVSVPSQTAPIAPPAKGHDVAASVTAVAAGEPAGALWGDNLLGATGPCPPLRIHLLHQVLLI
jgi:hypothetical protein